MLWGQFLHLYQPHGQDPDVLEAIVEQCYRPVFEGVVSREHAKITLNINASLLELFDKYGYHDLIDMLKQGGDQGNIEFTSSAKYHALLPFLPESEMRRQLSINDDTNRQYLGDAYQPRGVFLPEMAYSPEVAPVLDAAGYDWVLLDEIAHKGDTGTTDYTKLYTIKNTDLHVFFRQRRVSNLIMSAVVRSAEKLEEAMRDELKNARYLVTGMDGETFGHHRTGLENLLFEIFDSSAFDLVRISDLLEEHEETEEVEPVACTWASSKKDIDEGVQFMTWYDPDNEIHDLQWKLRDLVLEQFNQLDERDDSFDDLRHKLDYAVASDQFFWASARPWWSIEMIEEGAYALLQIIQQQPNVEQAKRDTAQNYYNRILGLAFEWKRSGKLARIRQEHKQGVRIPFKERTIEEGGEEEGVYRAFVDMMKRQEQEASDHQDYEEAIIWRDAVYKLENKLDIYDAMHVVDLLRTRLPNDDVEEMIEAYKDEYRYIRGGQPEQRG